MQAVLAFWGFMASHSKGNRVFTHYLDWKRAVEERTFYPLDIDEHFPEKCLDLLEAGYYIRSGGATVGLPRSRDPIFKCNAVFERFNRDDREDGYYRRSFSVGDIVQVGKRYFVCRSVGWQELAYAGKGAETAKLAKA